MGIYWSKEALSLSFYVSKVTDEDWDFLNFQIVSVLLERIEPLWSPKRVDPHGRRVTHTHTQTNPKLDLFDPTPHDQFLVQISATFHCQNSPPSVTVRMESHSHTTELNTAQSPCQQWVLTLAVWHQKLSFRLFHVLPEQVDHVSLKKNYKG